jgi:hypothetical protein
MRGVILSVLLLVAGSASAPAAPAPFPKTPPASARRVWQIDPKPLASAPDRAFRLDLTFETGEENEGDRTRLIFMLAVQAGRVSRAASLLYYPECRGGQYWIVKDLTDLTAEDAVRRGVLRHDRYHLGHDEGTLRAAANGAVLEAVALMGRPVARVTVDASDLEEKYFPVVRRAPSRR